MFAWPYELCRLFLLYRSLDADSNHAFGYLLAHRYVLVTCRPSKPQVLTGLVARDAETPINRIEHLPSRETVKEKNDPVLADFG